jgi:hypothetical protein
MHSADGSGYTLANALRPNYLHLSFALPEPMQSSATASSLPERSEAELRACVISHSATADRIIALEELQTIDAGGLDALVIQVLNEAATEPEFRRFVTHFAQSLDSRDPGRRKELANLLFREAIALRDSPDVHSESPLWAAIRTFAALTGLRGMTMLREFLRKSDTRTTVQVALQSIQAILELTPPGGDDKTHALSERVQELATKYLDLDIINSAPNVVFAEAAYCAAVLLGVSQSVSLTHQLLGLGQVRMARRSLQVIAGACEARARTGVAVGQLETIRSLLQGM